MENHKVIIWGGTGQATVVADIIGRKRILAIFDNNTEVLSPLKDIPIFYGEQGFQKWHQSRYQEGKQISYVTAIGWNKGNAREEISGLLLSYGYVSINVIHKSAVVSQSAKLGTNNQVLAQAYIGPEVLIGNNCIINTKSIVEHDCILYDNVDIAPGCILLGEVSMGKNSAIGAGTIILPKVHIGSNVIIGAGSVVDSDIEDGMRVICNRREKIIF